MKSALLASAFDSLDNFLSTIADALQYDVLLYIFIGLFALLVIMTIIRLRFTYEVRAIKSFKKINNYFLKKPYINDSNLVEFNRLMKKIPYQLRDRWQYFMLNREGLPSSYMTLYHCVEQPIKTSSYKATIVMLKYISNVCVALCTLLCLFLVSGGLTGASLVQALIIPIGFFILTQLYIYFLNAKFNAVSVDLYEYYLAFVRNLDKASASIPDYVDYELLFTDKEIRDGIPVLREFLEKRALLDKIAREKAKQNENERESFDFTNLGIDGSLLVERAMTTSQDYLNTRNRLRDEITKLENEKEKYDAQYISLEKDSQRKLQAIKENLDRLQAQLEASANRIEANYIKKQQGQEKNKQAEIEKNLEDLHVKYAQQVQFLEAEIAKRKEAIDADKKNVSEQMDAEFATYNEKVYTLLRNKIDEDDADELKVTRAQLDETRDKLTNTTQEKDNLQLTLDIKGQEIDTMQSKIDMLNDKVAKLTSRDRRNIAKMYDENIELKNRVAELESQLAATTRVENTGSEPVYYDSEGNVVDFSQYYDENGCFKEFPKVYDAEGNYYDFAEYYDKYGNPLDKGETDGDGETDGEGGAAVANTAPVDETDASEPQVEETQTEEEQAETQAYEPAEPEYEAPSEPTEETPVEESQTWQAQAEEVQSDSSEMNEEEQRDYDDMYSKLFGNSQEESAPQQEARPHEVYETIADVLNEQNPADDATYADEPSVEDNQNVAVEQAGGEDESDIVYYDVYGNPVDFEQYYDENGRFKEFPKVYDKYGNYYDFADYYDEYGNLLSDAGAVNEDDITPISEDEEQEVILHESEDNAPNSAAGVVNNANAQAEPYSTQVSENQNVEPAKKPSVASQTAQTVAAAAVAEQPVKRGRGRPRKVQTDDAGDADKPKKRRATRVSTKKEPAKKTSKTTAKKSTSSAAGTKTTAKKSTAAKKTTAASKSTAAKSTAAKTDAKKKTTKSGTKNKATTKTRARRKPQAKPDVKTIDDELDQLNGQINSEFAILEQKQADLKNKISQTLSELQERPTVDRDLDEIKEIMNKLKAQAAEAKKNGFSKEEQQQINRSLAELLRAMANKTGGGK